MKRFDGAISAILQTLVIAAILFVIFFGLYKIGLVELPAKNGENPGTQSDDGGGYADVPDTFDRYEKTTLTEESVRTMLSALTEKETYSLSLEYVLYDGEDAYPTRLVVQHDGNTDAAYFMDGDTVEKLIVSQGDTMSFHTVRNGETRSVSLPSGDFAFEQQIGAVLTQRQFLETPDAAYTYELYSDGDSVYLVIRFTSTSGGYTQEQEYTIDMDYGIVVSVKCTENGERVYTSNVTELSENLTPRIELPEKYKALADAAFSAEGEEQQ